MKFKAILILAFVSPVFAAPLRDFEKRMLPLYSSNDRTTRITAYLLTAEIQSEPLRGHLRLALKGKARVERTAILYALNTPSASDSDRSEFVKSISKDSAFLRELIEADIGETSLVKGAPYLHMIDLLGRIAISDDAALDRLQAIYRLSDGWIAESVFSLIEQAREQRLKRDLEKFRMEKEH